MRQVATARKSQPPPPAAPAPPHIRGNKAVDRPLTEVKPNTWNPNEMTPFMKASLKQGLQQDGWLRSQSLLVWGTDEKGKTKNIIIDGEHRWTVAGELGFKKGPMVFLEGVTEAQAKALTIKMNQKRGEHDPDKLGLLVRELQFTLNVDNIALDLGIEQGDLMTLLANDDGPNLDLDGKRDNVNGAPPGDVASGRSEHVGMVQLFFNKEQHAEYLAIVKDVARGFGTKNVSDTTLEAMRRARTAAKSRS